MAEALALSPEGNAASRRFLAVTLRARHLADSVTVRLDPELVFEVSLQLPAAAGANLRSIVSHQIERLVPLKATELVFDAQVVSRIADGRLINVRVAIAKKATIARALAILADHHLSAITIEASPDQHAPSSPAVFWRTDQRRGPSAGRVHRRLELVALLLAVALYGLHVVSLNATLDRLSAEIDRARAPAELVQARSRDLARRSEIAAFLDSRRHEPSPLAIIDTLTRDLPDDSWLSQLMIHDSHVEMIGTAQRATEILSRLQADPLFEKPRFSTAITIAADGKSEHFGLALEIRKRERMHD